MTGSHGRSAWNFYTGNQFTFGPGAHRALASLIHRQQARRVLLIADPELENHGRLADIKRVLSQPYCLFDVFLDPHVHPTTNHVDDAAAVAACFEPDLIIAVGGGSTLDLAKAACAAATLDCEARELFGVHQVARPMAPLTCVPTTAGSGSDVSHRAFIRDADSRRLGECISPTLRPDHALVDPTLVLSCPPQVTARSGAVALSNAVEATLGVRYDQLDEPLEGLPFEGNNPLSDMLARHATELISQHLQASFERPHDLPARSMVSLGATLAGAALTNSGYSMATAVTLAIMNARADIVMGDVVLIVLPEVIRLLSANSPDRVLHIARTMVPDLQGLPVQEHHVAAATDGIAAHINQLRTALDLPASLADLGISADDIPRIASAAVRNELASTMTPVQISVDAVIDVLHACSGPPPE